MVDLLSSGVLLFPMSSLCSHESGDIFPSIAKMGQLFIEEWKVVFLDTILLIGALEGSHKTIEV